MLSLSSLLFLSFTPPVTSSWCTLSFSPSLSIPFQLFYTAALSISTWTCLLFSLSCPPLFSAVLFVPPTLPSVSPHLPPSLHLCALNLVLVIVSASLLGWRLSKGPQDPHTLRVSSHARDALSLLSPLISVHLIPLHLHRTEEKVKMCLFWLFLLSLFSVIKVIRLSLYLSAYLTRTILKSSS